MRGSLTMAVGGDLSLDLPEKIHEELLMCKICYEKFSLRLENMPKLLVCSHTFCANCIKEYLAKRKKKSKFPCPLCRKETSLSKDGVKGLTNNYTILGLIDLLEHEKNQENHDHGKRSSKTIHVTGKTTNFALDSDRVCRSKHKKWNTAQVRAQPGFADLGLKCVSPKEVRRPPPLNPDFSSSPTTDINEPGPSNQLWSSSEKPDVPKRIPGARSSIGRKKGKELRKLLTSDRPQSMHFPSAPEEDPYADTTSILSETIGSLPNSPTRVVSPPKPPPRRVSSESVAATPIRCLRKFGQFSEARMQTNAFTEPTKVSVSEANGNIIVIDSLQMTLQVFNSRGEYISMFKVIGIQGACYMSTDKITVVTHRGIEIYKPNGDRIKEIQTGSCVSVIPYKFGFIVAKTRSVLFFSNGLIQYKEISKIKTGKLRSSSFKCIQDITVNALKDLIILDSGRGEIYIMDCEGNVKVNINPTKETCGSFKQPEAITTDKWNNILVSDTGNNRVLKFSANGTYARCLLNFQLWCTDRELQTHGVAVTSTHDKMVIIITGNRIAYIAIYQL